MCKPMASERFIVLSPPKAVLLPTRMEAYFDDCHSIIWQYAKDGWRFVTVLKPFGDNTVSELVFERPFG